jgi:hypothetical protein
MCTERAVLFAQTPAFVLVKTSYPWEETN